MQEELIDISALQFDDKNANRGTNRGQKALNASLKKLGTGRSILIDSNGKVIAGNKTLKQAKNLGYKNVRVIKTRGDELIAVQREDLDMDSDPRARELAVADNRVSELGLDWDSEVISELSDQFDFGNLFTGAELGKFLKESHHDIKKELDEIEEQSKKDDKKINCLNEQVEIFAYREDAIFPSSNFYGIPDLREDMLGNAIPDGVYEASDKILDLENLLHVHGTSKYNGEMNGGILCFYVDDYRFENIWHDAVKFIESLKLKKYNAVVAPDFSLWRNTPRAFQIFNTYRSRWCARYWQEAGIKIIPSLNWSDEESYQFSHLGIPKNAPVVSCQCRTSGDAEGKAFFIKGIVHAIDVLCPKSVAIYGGIDHKKWLEKFLPKGKCQFHLIESWTHKRARIRKGTDCE